MLLKTIGILLAASAIISAKNLASGIVSDNSGEDDEYFELLFNSSEEHEKSDEKKYTVCQTDDCKIIARELRTGMNTSVDPCENFYDYVCGAWNDRMDLIPSYERSWGRIELFQHTVYKRIKCILEVEPLPSDILPVRQAKKWYEACINEEREKRGLKPIESILMQTGGWPMIMDPEEWSDEDFIWQELEKNYFYITGDMTFYSITPHWRTNRNGTASQIRIDGDRLPLTETHHYYDRSNGDKKVWDKYKSFVKRVAKEFIKHNGAAVSDEMIDNDIEALVEFEKKLYNMTNVYEASVETTVGEFIAEYDANVTDIPGRNRIHFEQLFTIMFNMVNYHIDKDHEIEVEYPSFYVRLTELLSETKKRTIANYMHWYFVSKVMFYTTDQIQTIWNEELVGETGLTENKPKWLECVRDMKLEHAASYVFATKYFTDRTEKYVTNMIEKIRQHLALQIQNANWLNEEEQNMLVERLNDIKAFIGFPEWYKNETAVKAAYKGLKVGRDYFENMLNFDKYKIREKLRFMKEQKKEEPWDVQPVIVNALYSMGKNNINVPAADFQPPLFTPGLPDAVNYGTVGCIIGHEIGHAFDNHGILYFRVREDLDEDDLSDQIIENYYKRAHCFMHQYNNYSGVTEPTYGGTTLPFYDDWASIGRRTMGENIADTTGLNSVFEAWREVNSKRGKEDIKLPGFEEFTDEQMFFIGFASTMCGVQRPKMLERMETRDTHSLRNIRVIGAVSNAEEFARVFNCPKGSPMNPEDKCQIWTTSDDSNEIPKRRHDRKRHRRNRWALNEW